MYTTVVGINVHNDQANSITLPVVLISLKKRGRKSSPGFILSAYLLWYYKHVDSTLYTI